MKTTNIQMTKMLIIEDLMKIDDIDVLNSIKRYVEKLLKEQDKIALKHIVREKCGAKEIK